MKNSVIKDIFNGVKGNREEIIKANNTNVKKVLESYEKLKDTFNEKQMKFIENFIEAYDINYYENMTSCFEEGFKLGIQVGAECFLEK